MSDAQQREAARQFFYKWNGKGKEDEDARSYWIDVLVNIFGVENVTDRVQFEKKVAGDKSMKRIDVYIPETHVLIEQKSLGIALDKPQPGHDNKTPYEQAKEYDNLLPYDEKARWIITSNFAEIWIYDMGVMKPEPVKITLADLQTKYHMLDFLVNKQKKEITEEVELSKAAGELVGKIRDRFLKQYNDPLAKRTQKSLNILCVRLVFCFYAEDAGLFGAKDAFCGYLMQYAPKDMRNALIELFRTLDTPLDERADLYLSDELAAFPYVNGGLFSDENIVIPKITQEIKDTLIESSKFDWSRISPTIFGAVFESTLNPETRRSGGMHYTSIENIHKVIDPLFLDELKEELDKIREIAVPGTQKKKLDDFQNKLASLVFLDPACGSGNFLTESYLSLRRLENEVLRLKVAADRKVMTGQIFFGFDEASPIRVSINQFYGIEINDFAVAVAKTALWIAEAQMFLETQEIVHGRMEFFPLQDYMGIVEGNALRIDWNDVVPKEKLNYVYGNPPFVGARYQTKLQKDDILESCIGKDGKTVDKAGFIDYVGGWYYTAASYIQGTKIECAFVSTNSIVQGEQVALIWKPLFEEYQLSINFGYQTFVWNSEATDQAHVHCVIIGFSQIPRANKVLFSEGIEFTVSRINGYLLDAPDCYIQRLTKPLYPVPQITNGNRAYDGNNLVLTLEEKDELIAVEPQAEPYIKKYYMGADLMKNEPRYVIWLVNCPPTELKKMPNVMKRVEAVKKMRLASKSASTLKAGETPALFQMICQPTHEYLAFPRVSSQRRRYIPMTFLPSDCICGDKLIIVPEGKIYHFGVLMSNVHNSWMRVVAGRLKSDYSYSSSVYNNFPWPDPTDEQKSVIEKTAQGILDARALYPDASLADLYDPLTMPPELRKAHQKNDAAVMNAYGMPIKETDEAACVAWLMRLYQERVAELESRK